MAGKFRGYSTKATTNASAIAHMKAYIARRVCDAAEDEIQAALKQLEQRIRARISEDIDCRIGDLYLDFDPLHQQQKVAIKIHVVESVPRPGTFAPKVDLGTGKLGPLRVGDA
jgi:hypothetical protein